MSENAHGPGSKTMPTALKQQRRHQPRRHEDERADWIGQELRKVYDEAVNEPIPDRLKELLSRLRTDEGSKS